MSHVHAHAPHELSEPSSEKGGERRKARVLELYAVVLLSLATLATAWSGYQAAKWSSEQSQHYALSSTLRIHAQEQATAAGQTHIADLLLVNEWIDAYTLGNKRLAAVYRHRFRAELQPVFSAWLALHPFTNHKAPPGPTFMPQYRIKQEATARALDSRANELYKSGTDAKTNDDDHVLATVFFAGVLFLAAVSLRVDWVPLQIAVLALGTVLFLGALVYVITLPNA